MAGSSATARRRKKGKGGRGMKEEQVVMSDDENGQQDENEDQQPLELMNVAWNWQHVVVIVLIGMYAFGCYYSSLGNGLVFDDRAAVKNNKDVTQQDSLWNLFFHDFWGQPIDHKESHKSYRPVTVLTFRFDHHLAGSLDTFRFHLTNVVCHVVVSMVVFVVGVMMFNPTFVGREFDVSEGHKGGLWFGGISGFLFAGHPIHTEAVSNIVGRAELLCMIFYGMAVVLYRSAAGRESSDRRGLMWTFVCFMLSVFAKETGITLLGVLAAYDVLFVILDDEECAQLFTSPFGVIRGVFGDTGRMAVLMKRMMFLLGTGMSYLWMRTKLMGEFTPVSVIRKLDNPLLFSPPNTRRLTIPYLHGFYTQLLVLPTKLCSDYSYNAIPMVESLSDPRNLVTIAPYAVIGLITVLVGKYGKGQDTRIVMMSVVWFVIPFLPASHMFLSVGTFVGERLMYIPSIGFCFLVAWAMMKAKYKFGGIAVVIVLGVVLGLYGVRTWNRNLDWESEEVLFVRAYEDYPNSAKNCYNMANIQLRHEKWGDALGYLKEAKKIWPEYCNVNRHMGMSLLKLGKTWEGLDRYIDAVECQQTKVKALRDIESLYEQLIAHRPSNVTNYDKLGFVLVQRKQYKKAVGIFQKGLQIDANHVNMNTNLGVLLAAMGQKETGKQLLRRALAVDPGNEKAKQHLANLG